MKMVKMIALSLLIISVFAIGEEFSIPTNNCPGTFIGFYENTSPEIYAPGDGSYNIELYSENSDNYWDSDYS